MLRIEKNSKKYNYYCLNCNQEFNNHYLNIENNEFCPFCFSKKTKSYQYEFFLKTEQKLKSELIQKVFLMNEKSFLIKAIFYYLIFLVSLFLILIILGVIKL